MSFMRGCPFPGGSFIGGSTVCMCESILRAELSGTREKLAQQHAMVRSLEKDEDLTSEKMVEQQLYLKQVNK